MAFKINKLLLVITFSVACTFNLFSQEYFYGGKGPFDKTIPSPEEFLGYGIGSHHTRYDRIVAYLELLAEKSEKASFYQYGMTHEYRPLVILTVSAEKHMKSLDNLQSRHLEVVDPTTEVNDFEGLPVFINLGYNVHGNEPSSSEAAMLTAYTLVASESAEVTKYLENAVVMIDPTINPDGRDRHSHWANMYKGTPMVDDPLDVEHNEAWPRGRTNHYWFDLNRDWWLAINPESRGKLNWYHQWYPNVVTDFHEMGTNSTYFFEPMKAIGSKDPIMPKENYTTLNETFANYFREDLNKIGSFYFTKEVFDGTYPGYGSSYPDLQGGLALLFEQASSRGHVQQTPMGKITFAFTIRNQYTSSLATVRASVENKDLLHRYQQDFFKTAISKAKGSRVKAYVFGDDQDENRTRAFIDKLLMHRIQVYELDKDLSRDGDTYRKGSSYIVPTAQPQYRLIQSAFETYKEFADSVFYDASSWSIANFYNMNYAPLSAIEGRGELVTRENNKTKIDETKRSDYAYLVRWKDYNAMAFLNELHQNKIKVLSAFKPFSISTNSGVERFDYGTLMIPVSKQEKTSEEVYEILEAASKKHAVNVSTVSGGYSSQGIDLGSGYFRPLKVPKALLLIGGGVSSYEAGEVWHLLDQRIGMPITKVRLDQFDNIDWGKYNTLVMVSGTYKTLDSIKTKKIRSWMSLGNTLVATRTASKWAVEKGLVKETLVKKEKPKKGKEAAVVDRLSYVNAPANRGKKAVGGTIFEVDLDLTHPIAFGYSDSKIPVYRNSSVWISPSKNAYSTVASYTQNSHIDGYITDENINNFLKKSASIVVSKVGSGRAILFAENPNFRGSWYGTNKLFMNAIYFGSHVRVPRE